MRMSRRYSVIILLSLVAIIFFCLNLFVPYYDDDVWYALRYIPGVSVGPIENFGDILVSQYHHYMGENSRAIIHITLQSLLSTLPYWGFDIVNTLVFILLIYLLSRMTTAKGSEPTPLSILLAVAGIYWLLPDMDYLFYWAAGSLNYLWTSAATLLFITLWHRIISHDEPIGSRTLLYALLAFVCSFTHEAFSLPVGAALLIYMLSHHRMIRLNNATITAIAYGLGCMAILLAPGLDNKAQNIGYASIQQYISDFIATLRNLKIAPLCAIICAVSVCRASWRKRLVVFVKENMFFVITAVTAFLFVASIRVGNHTLRIFYAAEFFALILLLRYVHTAVLANVSARTTTVVTWIVGLLLVAWAIIVVPAASNVGKQHHQLFNSYANDSDGILFIPESHTPAIAQPWVMNLEENYYTAPEAEWRTFVIPLVGLDTTLEIPTPLIARNADNSYKLYDKYIQVLPQALEPAIMTPETFFTADNKVAGDNPFYITTNGKYVITPLDSLESGDKWLWHYLPASRHDSAASLSGMLRRVIAPHSLPLYEPMQFPDTVTLPNDCSYVVYGCPPYRTLQGIVKE